MKIAIIGAGALGLVVASALVCRGCSVTVYEKGRIAGRGAASAAAQLRVFGAYLAPTAQKIRAVERAGEHWATLFGELGANLLFRRGVLRIVRPEESSHQASTAFERDCRSEKVPIERMTKSQAQKRYPYLALDEVDEVLVMGDWGYFFPRRILAGLARHITAQGARLHTNLGVIRLGIEDGTVETSAGSEHFERVVLATGALASDLVPALHDILKIQSIARIALHPAAERVRAWVRSPVVLDPDGCHAAITPCEGGADLAFESLTWLGEGETTVFERPQDIMDRPWTKQFYQCAMTLLQAPHRFPPRAAVAVSEAAARDGKPLSWYHGRVLAVGGLPGDGFQFAPLIAESAARCLLDGADPQSTFDWL